MTPDVLQALLEDPDGVDEATWAEALQELGADPAARARLVLHARMGERLSRLLDPARVDFVARVRYRCAHPGTSGRFVQRVMRQTRQTRRRGWGRRLLLPVLGVAAALAVAILVRALGSGPVAGSALIIAADGARVTGPGGGQAPARAGATLAPGATIVVDAGSAAIGFVGEPTRMDLQAGTTVRCLPPAPGRRLELVDGTLTAAVARQPEGAPLVIVTASAEITVVGTHFTLTASDAGTRLSVASGLVVARRRGGPDEGEPIRVAAGETTAIASVRTLLACDFEDGARPASLLDGQVVAGPARAGNRFCVEAVDFEGPGGWHKRTAMFEFKHPYVPGSSIAFDMWCRSASAKVVLSCWITPAAANYNLEQAVEQGRWVHLRIPMDELRHEAHGARSPPEPLAAGDAFWNIEIATFGDPGDALFIDNFAIVQP